MHRFSHHPRKQARDSQDPQFQIMFEKMTEKHLRTFPMISPKSRPCPKPKVVVNLCLRPLSDSEELVLDKSVWNSQMPGFGPNLRKIGIGSDQILAL
ncbi:hypothetical protein Trydic_g3455 [Trypoxylus dichotomus]